MSKNEEKSTYIIILTILLAISLYLTNTIIKPNIKIIFYSNKKEFSQTILLVISIILFIML